MLDIMMNVIYRNLGKRTTDDAVIDEILEAIEEEGMLPPRVKSEDPGRTYVYHNFWEPEE